MVYQHSRANSDLVITQVNHFLLLHKELFIRFFEVWCQPRNMNQNRHLSVCKILSGFRQSVHNLNATIFA